MQPSVRTGWLRAALLGVAVVLFVVCAIGLASVVSANRYAAGRPPAVIRAPGAVRAPAVVRAPAAVKAPPRAVRSGGRLPGLVAPLSAQRGAAVRDRATSSGSALRPLARRVSMVGRSRKAQVMVSALGDPKVTVGSQPTGVAVSATRAYVANQGSGSVSVIDLTQSPPWWWRRLRSEASLMRPC